MGEVVRLLADANAFLTKKIEVGVLVMGWATGRNHRMEKTTVYDTFTMVCALVFYGLLWSTMVYLLNMGLELWSHRS
jgi:hypothetical protein